MLVRIERILAVPREPTTRTVSPGLSVIGPRARGHAKTIPSETVEMCLIYCRMAVGAQTIPGSVCMNLTCFPASTITKLKCVTDPLLSVLIADPVQSAATVYVPENVEVELEPPKLTVINPETFPAPSAVTRPTSVKGVNAVMLAGTALCVSNPLPAKP
jgi:hypothetical protein